VASGSRHPPLAEEEARLLREFLAERDVLCPRCGYNLRGLDKPYCPECGLAIRFPATSATTQLTESERLARWLRDHDLICKKCKTNLRGGSSNVCPTCGATYMLQHTENLYADPAATPGRRQKTWAGLVIVLIPLGLLLFCFGVALLLGLLGW
jgi:predicted amidophosphoribosyltransferase